MKNIKGSESMNVLEYFRELEVKEYGKDRKYKRIEVGKKVDLDIGKVYLVNEQEYKEIIDVLNKCKQSDEQHQKELEMKDKELERTVLNLGISYDKVVDTYDKKIKELEDKLDELKEDKNVDRIRFNNTLTKLNSLGIIDVIRNKHKRIIDDSRLLVDSQAKDVEVIETKE